MRSKKLLIELLNYIELFEESVQHKDESNVENFIHFTHDLLAKQKSLPKAYNKSEQDMCNAGIAKDISMLHRYSRTYIKKALIASEHLQTEDEYTYLVTLMAQNGLTKTELNNRNGLEKTSGSEIIRRLRKYELIEEEPNAKDKRSVRVFITDKGRRELAAIFPMLRLSANTLTAPIDDDQKETLRLILRNLCSAHANIFPMRNDLSLDQTYEALQRRTNNEKEQ